jgi:hypothetical protein
MLFLAGGTERKRMLGRSLGRVAWLGWLSAVTEVIVRLVQPIFTRRIEDVEINRVFLRPGFMGHVGWNAQHFTGLDDDFFAVDCKFQSSLQNVGHLLIVVMVKWNVRAFFHDDAGQH